MLTGPPYKSEGIKKIHLLINILLYKVVISVPFCLKGSSSCSSYEDSDQEERRFLRSLPWNCSRINQELYVKWHIYDCYELGPEESVPMGHQRITYIGPVIISARECNLCCKNVSIVFIGNLNLKTTCM